MVHAMVHAMDGWADWVAAMRRRGLADGTIYKRHHELEHWSAFVGDRWADVDRHELERWLDGRPLAARARYSAISHLHAFYTWAIREGLCTADPTILVERPKLPRCLPRPARAALVARAVGDGLTPVELACALMAYGGLRCCEVARLTWDDVEPGRLWLRGKGDKDRVVPIARPLAVVLAQHDGRVGPIMGRRVTPGRVSQLVCVHLHRLGGGRETAHTLRHAFATRLLALCGDVTVVQVALGHASLATTAIYAQVEPAALTAALARW
jgi:site-specific recombinase XerD